MDFLASPAGLGGVVMGAVVSGWLLGRWHGAQRPRGADAGGAAVPESAPLADAPEAPAAVSACQHAARAERRQVIEAARSLGELHAEITAYRHQEQVLASAVNDGVLFDLVADSARQACRYLGLIGQPTCPLPGVGHESCNGCAVAAASRRAPAAQPSAEPSSALTRV